MKRSVLIAAGLVATLAAGIVAWDTLQEAATPALCNAQSAIARELDSASPGRATAGKETKDMQPDSPPITMTFSRPSCKELLLLAREAVKAAVEGKSIPHDPRESPELAAKVGCFVTLKNKGRLRGCIGQFTSDAPLWRTVREVAVSSATLDSRFAHDPITAAELPELDIEISVLSPMRPITKPLEQIKLGRDGIVISDRGRSGTFLPQVASETGWSLEEFLGHCARDKAGLGWDGWKSPTARVLAYSVTIISEKDFSESELK